MANRISHFFNCHGPSVTIDTGCSGSLVAVHLAIQSLQTGESSMVSLKAKLCCLIWTLAYTQQAIVAGVGVMLSANTMIPMNALNFLSPDGKCFTFDSRANGYGRGEGVGVVVLKRVSDAIRDNDTIRAIIRGSRVNQDGHTTGKQIHGSPVLFQAYSMTPRHHFTQQGSTGCQHPLGVRGSWA
jgi:acyl transferase domain-containing protein